MAGETVGYQERGKGWRGPREMEKMTNEKQDTPAEQMKSIIQLILQNGIISVLVSIYGLSVHQGPILRDLHTQDGSEAQLQHSSLHKFHPLGSHLPEIGKRLRADALQVSLVDVQCGPLLAEDGLIEHQQEREAVEMLKVGSVDGCSGQHPLKQVEAQSSVHAAHDAVVDDLIHLRPTLPTLLLNGVSGDEAIHPRLDRLNQLAVSS